MKILIVEDDVDSRMVLQKNLEGAGHSVAVAVNGEDALEKARTSPPDLIISDILMPVMDGFKLCYEVKNDKTLNHIPFVFYTATYVDLDDERLAIGLGASRFIIKPMEPDKFLEIIGEVIEDFNKGELSVPDEPVDEPLNLFRKYDAALTRKLEKKMRALELYQMVFNNSTEAIAIADRNGFTIIRQNPAQQMLIGYSDEELRGKSPDVYFSKDTLATIRKDIDSEEGSSGEASLKTRSGDRLFVEYSVFPIKNEQNNVTAYVWMLRDCTKRKMAKKQLQEERDKLEAITRGVGAGIAVVSKDFRTIWANKVIKDIFGDVEGKLCYETFNQRDAVCPGCGVQEIFEKNLEETVHEQVGKSASGETVWSQIISTPLKDAKGNITAALEVVVDITEQKSLAAQLLQAQKMEAVGNLAGGVAHDFNNMLTAIIGNVELAKLRFDTADPVTDELRQIESSAQRAAKLVRQLLLFSRKQPMEFVSIDLNRTIEDLFKMLQRIIGEDVDLRMELCENQVEIDGDPGNIDQVVMNLAVNARDAMGQGGILTIKTETVELDEEYCKNNQEARSGKFVCLSLTDNGEGMPEEVRLHIFEPFYTTKGIGKGTGIGLAVVYGIVKSHHGWINVYSEPGQGTSFKIFFPLVKQKAGEAKEEEQVSIAQVRGKGEKVLLVEDDEATRNLAAIVLQRNGYSVVAASTAEEGLDLFFKNSDKEFNLVVSDVVLPGMNGIEFVDLIREEKPGLPVLLCSGYADQKMHWPLIHERGFPFLEKPFTVVRLLQTVKNALGEAEKK